MWYFNWFKISKKIGILVLVVLAYFLIDYVGLIPKFMSFKKNTGSKLELSSSPAIIKEVKQINELITAEYFGEVYADLLEVYNDSIAKYGDSIKAYPPVIFGSFPGFSSYFVRKNKAKFTRNLVYIARGTVKMGFNFGELDSSSFKIRSQNDTIYVAINKPEILDADINPWYVENKIQGFEVFRARTAGTGFSDEEIKALKHKCKQKLENEARDFGLYEQAQKNGKKLIQNLFQLMSSKPVIVNYIGQQ